VDELTRSGFLSALIPEQYGGQALSMAEACVIMEEVRSAAAAATATAAAAIEDTDVTSSGVCKGWDTATSSQPFVFNWTTESPLQKCSWQ